jgi:hypothetical protein
MSMLRSRSSGGRLVRSTSPRKMVYGGKMLAAAPGGRPVRNTNPQISRVPCPEGRYRCPPGSLTHCSPCIMPRLEKAIMGSGIFRQEGGEMYIQDDDERGINEYKKQQI